MPAVTVDELRLRALGAVLLRRDDAQPSANRASRAIADRLLRVVVGHARYRRHLPILHVHPIQISVKGTSRTAAAALWRWLDQKGSPSSSSAGTAIGSGSGSGVALGIAVCAGLP